MPLLQYLEPGRIEVGCDEAGRGCLAGPVAAAAVILPKDCNILYINDSKQLSEAKREELYEVIKENSKAFFHSDITQAVGKIKVDLTNVDLASFILDIEPRFIAYTESNIRNDKEIMLHMLLIDRTNEYYLSDKLKADDDIKSLL